MSVNNGQRANQGTFNAAFLSRTAATTDTVAQVSLKNTETESGPEVDNVQREINSLNSMLGRTPGADFDTPGSVPSFGLKIPMVDFTVANGQGAATNVVDVSAYQAIHITGQLSRTTASGEKSSIVDLYAFKRFNSSAWDLTVEEHGDDAGVTWSITAAGVIQYVSDSLGGSGYSGTFTYCGMTFN